MAKQATAVEDAAPVIDEAPADFPLTLDEFCTRLSLRDKRVEMIGGFYHVEKQSSRLKDTEAAFAERYAAFQNQPA